MNQRRGEVFVNGSLNARTDVLFVTDSLTCPRCLCIISNRDICILSLSMIMTIASVCAGNAIPNITGSTALKKPEEKEQLIKHK